MQVLSAKIIIYIPYASSLKDKRQVSRSLIDKTRCKFNVSIAEVETLDTHQILTLGISLVSNNFTQAQTILDKVITFIENNTDAEITEIYTFSSQDDN